MEDIWLYALLVCLVTGFLGRYVAIQKGRDASEGFLIGLLFNLLGVLIISLLPNKEIQKQKEPQFSDEELKAQKEKADRINKKNIKTGNILLVIVILLILAAFFFNKQ